MDDKGIQGFALVLEIFFTLNIPVLFVGLFDILTFPIRLIWATVIPDSVLFS